MHVGVISETYPPEINGVALTVQTMVEHLLALGHRVTLIRPRQAQEQAAETIDPRWCQRLVPSAPLPRYHGLRVGWPVFGRLRRWFREQRPDALYIATEGPLGWAALFAARRAQIPVATGFHTRFDEFVTHYGLRFLRGAALSYLRAFHNRADCTLVPTRELAEFLQAHGVRSVQMLRRSVDTRLFNPARRSLALRAEWGIEPAALAVIFVGRIAPEKNLELAVRSFDAIQARHPSARFIWVGDGPSRAELQRARPGDHFAGMRRGEDLARHYASADLFLFPSLTETFGNVTLEAMASGLDVIAFDYGAAHEHIGADPSLGSAVAFGDHVAFIRAAVEAADAIAQGQRRGGTARRAVEHLSPQQVSADLVAILEQLSRTRAKHERADASYQALV